MKEVIIKTYTFAELSDEAKEKAIYNNYNINVDTEWWEFTKEDAEQIGLKIESFDIDHGTINCSNYEDYTTIKQNILKEHGKMTETYKTVITHDLRKDEGEDMVRMLGEDYLIILRNKFEYLTSEEAIIETFKCNDYIFTDDGNIYN